MISNLISRRKKITVRCDRATAEKLNLHLHFACSSKIFNLSGSDFTELRKMQSLNIFSFWCTQFSTGLNPQNRREVNQTYVLPFTDKDYNILSPPPLSLYSFFLFAPFAVYICDQDAMKGKSLRLDYNFLQTFAMYSVYNVYETTYS